MSAPFPADALVAVAPGYRFQFEPAQGCHVLLYPEGMIQLNDAATEILKRCDGSLTVEGIVATLEAQFPGADLRGDVLAFIDEASDKGWIHGA